MGGIIDYLAYVFLEIHQNFTIQKFPPVCKANPICENLNFVPYMYSTVCVLATYIYSYVRM